MPASEAARLCRTATSLLKLGSPLQSTQGVAPVTDATLRTSLIQHLRIEEANLATQEGRPPSDVVPSQVAGDIVSAARNALKRFENGSSPATLSEYEHDALQAIIQVTGRPALQYLDGYVQLPISRAAENEHWHVLIAVARKQIDAVSRSVGCVQIERPGAAPELIGTAWRLGEDLLVTNRHVAARLVVARVSDSSQWRLDATLAISIDFAATEGTPVPSQFPIVALEYCAAEPSIDFAVLRLAKGGGTVPVGLAVDAEPEALGRVVEQNGDSRFVGTEVYVVGHPLRKQTSTQIEQVFGRADGKKRCSPGYVTSVGSEEAVLEHDCSTLGGNSGSCVMSRARHAVVGVHFGSLDTDRVTAVAAANVAIALAHLGQHPAAQILRTGRISGKP